MDHFDKYHSYEHSFLKHRFLEANRSWDQTFHVPIALKVAIGRGRIFSSISPILQGSAKYIRKVLGPELLDG